jgi:CRP/FNR family transcriptional regulator, cyclic AMP receptor protein
MIALAGHELLDLISDEARDWLALTGQRRAYSDGELIHSRGDSETTMGIVIKGHVRLCRLHADGSQTYVSLVRKGQHFGDVLLVSGPARRTHDAVAVGNVLIDHYDATAFQSLMEHPEVLAALYRITALRLKAAMAMSDDLRAMSREAHLAKILLALLRQAGASNRINCVQEDLASMLGTSTMTLSKCLAALKRQGLIETGYRVVRIPDPPRLRKWLADQA